MSVSDYMNDRKAAILLCITGSLFFAALLWLFGLEADRLLLLFICFFCMAACSFLSGYLRSRKRILYLKSVMDALDQKYLFAEIARHPESELEKVYFRLMKTALKSMTDEVSGSRLLTREYREFVEQWIHEIKVPLTGIQLLCENNRSDVTQKILAQTEAICLHVERVLYYARLGSVEKDYMITEVSLKDCALEVLAAGRQFLILNNTCVQMDNLLHTVYSDRKWLAFILNQIISNSIKYQSDRSPHIELASQDHGTCVTLSVTDNGIGIKESEIGRVFDKGFVGSNGRAGNHATGIGLYLCGQLCDRLGIGIEIKSAAGQYTTVLLHFPKSSGS